ncbi:MAG: hypothetical protein QG637_1321, partial [Chloroflexota bacterium]|nr:hypothetical protein [Chloroflexota bacterium]
MKNIKNHTQIYLGLFVLILCMVSMMSFGTPATSADIPPTP